MKAKRVQRLPIVATAFALAAMSLYAAGPVAARCNPSRFTLGWSEFAGTHGSWFDVQGAKADIEEDNPWVATNSEVSAWVMLATDLPTGTWWAQVGWMNDDVNNAESRTVFMQYVSDQGVVVQGNWPAKPLGAMTTYQQLYDAATKKFTMIAGGTTVFSTTNNWVPDLYQVEGETHNRADQMPGMISNHELLWNTYVKHGGVWWSLTTPASVSESIYAAQRVNSVNYQVWDLGCP